MGFALACVLGLGWLTPLTALVQLLGTTALIMGGTEHPLVNPSDRLPDHNGFPNYGFAESGLAGDDGLPAGYVAYAMTLVSGAGPADEGYNVMAVWSPEAFWPVFGNQTFDDSVATGVGNLNQCARSTADCIAHVYPEGAGGETDSFAVFAYSQSARVASLEKAALIDAYDPEDPSTIHHVTFVMIGNPNRPNGGILERFSGLHIPILNVSFDGATTTGSPVVDGEYLYPTVDIARQYDGWTDFPMYPLNLLADLNSLAGILYLHPDYFVGDHTNPVAGQPYLYQGQTGDTNYYMLATKRLPLLLPLQSLGVPEPILAALDAPLRVLVELGYNRAISPGMPTTAKLFGTTDPVTALVHLVAAVFTGLDDAVALATGDPDSRPFGTTPTQSTFGVGGAVLPTVDTPAAPTPPVQAVAALKSAPPNAGRSTEVALPQQESAEHVDVLEDTSAPEPVVTDPAPETTAPVATTTEAPKPTVTVEPDPEPEVVETKDAEPEHIDEEAQDREPDSDAADEKAAKEAVKEAAKEAAKADDKEAAKETGRQQEPTAPEPEKAADSTPASSTGGGSDPAE